MAGTEVEQPCSQPEAGTMEGQCTENSGCTDCLEEGTWYRFDTLNIDALDGNNNTPVKSILNVVWSGDINDQYLNILIQILEVQGDSVRARALNAAWTGEGDRDICLLEQTAVNFEFQKSGCGFEANNPTQINVYAGSQEIPKNCAPNAPAPNAIPVREVKLSGRFTNDCVGIIDGKVLNAVLKESDLDQICTCLIDLDSCAGLDPTYEGMGCAGCNTNYNNLNEQLRPFGTTYSCESDGERGVCLDASYSAQQLSYSPSPCSP